MAEPERQKKPRRRRKKAASRPAPEAQKQGKSIEWVVGALMVLILLGSWAMMAGEYAKAEEGWRSDLTAEAEFIQGSPRRLRGGAAMLTSAMGFVDFLENAVVQIPSVFSVLRFTLTEKLWIPVTTILLLATAAGAGYGIRKVEHHLESTAPKHSPPDYR